MKSLLNFAIVNNGHMINMQKVAEAYTAETGVNLNWVSLEEGVLREQVTSDTATGGGQYDIINIGMQEAPRVLHGHVSQRPHRCRWRYGPRQ